MSDHSPVEPVHPSDHARGAAAPAVTIVLYGDYDCPHTRASHPILARLLSEAPDVRLVFRHFPLRHLHANAETLSRIAEAAARQGKFWPMHDHLMHHRAPVDAHGVTTDAAEVGVDLAQIERDIRDPAIAARVEHDVTRGKESGVHSTPSFFFDGVLHDGHYDYDTLAARLREARARRGALPA